MQIFCSGHIKEQNILEKYDKLTRSCEGGMFDPITIACLSFNPDRLGRIMDSCKERKIIGR